MGDFTVLLIIACAIINLVFFCKMWGMTNSVEIIKNAVRRKRPFICDILKAILIASSNKAKATEILIETFIQEVSLEFINQKATSESIKKIRDKYVEAFSKSEIECPDILSNISSQSDINSIFKSNR